eukprot:472445_1
MSPQEQILQYKGKELKDATKLSEYNIKERSTLYLHSRLRGGIKPWAELECHYANCNYVLICTSKSVLRGDAPFIHKCATRTHRSDRLYRFMSKSKQYSLTVKRCNQTGRDFLLQNKYAKDNIHLIMIVSDDSDITNDNDNENIMPQECAETTTLRRSKRISQKQSQLSATTIDNMECDDTIRSSKRISQRTDSIVLSEITVANIQSDESINDLTDESINQSTNVRRSKRISQMTIDEIESDESTNVRRSKRLAHRKGTTVLSEPSHLFAMTVDDIEIDDTIPHSKQPQLSEIIIDEIQSEQSINESIYETINESTNVLSELTNTRRSKRIIDENENESDESTVMSEQPQLSIDESDEDLSVSDINECDADCLPKTKYTYQRNYNRNSHNTNNKNIDTSRKRYSNRRNHTRNSNNTNNKRTRASRKRYRNRNISVAEEDTNHNNDESSDDSNEIQVTINPPYRQFSRTVFPMNKRPFNQPPKKKRYTTGKKIKLFVQKTSAVNPTPTTTRNALQKISSTTHRDKPNCLRLLGKQRKNMNETNPQGGLAGRTVRDDVSKLANELAGTDCNNPRKTHKTPQIDFHF